MSHRQTDRPGYRGRFAPSPTGPLHFGSLVAALGSCLDARHHGGQWLLRMEDLDVARNQPGAAEGILRTLERLGFAWDGPVTRQSERLELYRSAFDALRRVGAVFPCACTRREIADSHPGVPLAEAAGVEHRYPGTCRRGLPEGRAGRAWRVLTSTEPVRFDDVLQGAREHDLENEVGDFVVLRADGLFAYQLAVAVDDADQGITHVVRGADLLDSAPRQIHLQRLLGLSTPSYLHLPVAANAQGEKLSKQTRAARVDALPVATALVAALGFLGQTPPPELARASRATLWAWALAHWDRSRLPRAASLPAPAGF